MRKSTIRTILASRENGRHSQGPATAESKSRSKFNALQHGLAAQTLVLSNESPNRFQQLLDSLLTAYQPANEEEYHCVQEMAAARWYTWRAHSVLTALADHAMDTAAPSLDAQFLQLDESTRLALATSTLAATPVLHEVHRTLVRSARLFDRHYQHLLRLKKNLGNDPGEFPSPSGNTQSAQSITDETDRPESQTGISGDPPTGDHQTPIGGSDPNDSNPLNGGVA